MLEELEYGSNQRGTKGNQCEAECSRGKLMSTWMILITFQQVETGSAVIGALNSKALGLECKTLTKLNKNLVRTNKSLREELQ